MLSNQTDTLLNLVSRSFALCIPLLPEKVRKNVSNFYLLCRYADTIEDSKLSAEQKKIIFAEFKYCIQKEDLNKIRMVNSQLSPHIINDNDKKMVRVFDTVLKEFSEFDVKTKKISKKWLFTMMRGMQKYSHKNIKDFRDLNNYCYFVAGTVGMYLTDIFTHKFNLEKEHPELVKRAKDFGLLLQKVNIIRDFSKDFGEGRVYWPKSLFAKHGIKVNDAFDAKNSESRQKVLREMIESTKTNLAKSIEYIQLLPKNEPGLRVFCAIPLCMAIPTLMLCNENEAIFNPQEKIKIDKLQTLHILDAVQKNILDDSFITNYCSQAMKA